MDRAKQGKEVRIDAGEVHLVTSVKERAGDAQALVSMARVACGDTLRDFSNECRSERCRVAGSRVCWHRIVAILGEQGSMNTLCWCREYLLNKRWVFISVLLGCLCLTLNARAQTTGTGSVTILSMGCTMAGPAGTPGSSCFAYVNANVGPPGCNTNSIRWDPTQSPNGQAALAQLTAAYLAGKQVQFVLYDTCWAEWPAYPTIYYYLITG